MWHDGLISPRGQSHSSRFKLPTENGQVKNKPLQTGIMQRRKLTVGGKPTKSVRRGS